MNKQFLQIQIRQEIEMLLRQATHPVIHADTDVVWVFSGPGTFDTPLDSDDAPWMRWMDRYRMLYGAAIVRAVTAKRVGKSVQDIQREDIRLHGPLFFYNGTPEENHVLRQAMADGRFALPSESVIIIDVVYERSGAIHPIEHTLDQVKSFPSSYLSPLGPIKRRIALVSHAPHIPRILRYIERYHPFPSSVTLEIFPLIPPRKGIDAYIEEEVEKVWEYFQKGDLSWCPFPSLE